MIGLVGSNINYSLSPALHNAAMQAFGIPETYQLFDFNPKSSGEEILNSLTLKAEEINLNITLPFKQSFGFLPSTQALHSINCLKGKQTSQGWDWECASFDGPAFWDTLGETETNEILFLGCGGTVLSILQNLRPGIQCTIFVRDPAKHASLQDAQVRLWPLEKLSLADRGQLVVNALPRGVVQQYATSLEGQKILHLNYAEPFPGDTTFGLKMLAAQAHLSQVFWWGKGLSKESLVAIGLSEKST